MSKIVVITGATKGLGRELSYAFGKAGYRVFGFFKSDQAAASAMRREFLDSGLNGEFLQNDITSEIDSSVWEKINGAGDDITLINNACAPFHPTPFHLLKMTDFQAAFDVSVKGPVLFTQALIRNMVQHRRGTIVNILSEALHNMPPSGYAAYLASKAALQAFTRSLAAEYSDRGVRAFSVSPSYLATPLTEKWDERLKSQIFAQGVKPQDTASVAAYILQLVEDSEVVGRGEDYVVI